MSKLIVRLLLSIFLIPLALIVFIVLAVSAENHFRGIRSLGVLVAGCVTWAVVALYWIMLWRDSVRWDRKRQQETIMVAVAAGVISVFLAILLDQVDRGLGDFIGCVTAPLLWLVGCVLVWKERPTERIQRLQSGGTKVLVCPSCGYNLTGLREVRCPECGLQMTLDELVAAQPRHTDRELDSE
jgi:hypothetical protein